MASLRPIPWLIPALFFASGLHAQPPDRKGYAETYDVRDLVEPPGSGHRTVLQLVDSIMTILDDPGTVEVLNGTRLVIRTSAARHADVADLLKAHRDRDDVAVFVKARLYEVDEATHTKLRTAKRVSLDELEERFLNGTLPPNVVYEAVAKMTPVLTGDEIKTAPGEAVALLSRYRVVRCGPHPERVRRGDMTRQTVLEGIGFRAGLEVSSDRRSIRVRLTERAVELPEVRKVKAWNPAGKAVDAEVPLPAESTVTQERDLADGGALLVPVQARPAARDRRWVLRIDARLYIAAEEQRFREQALPGPATRR